MRTLSIDIGGTGIKAICLNEAGEPVTERSRIETPHPSPPSAVLAVIAELVKDQGEFDRVSVGFPGVVIEGVTKTAPNLGTEDWAGFELAAAVRDLTGKPTRCANDCGVQGHGVIEGRGVEMVITLGTGMGCALYVDGTYVPNIELGHHPFGKKKGESYEDRVSDAERKRIGNKRWRKRVDQVIAQVEPLFNYRVLYIGGGNSRRLDASKLPDNVSVVDNVAGLLGGIRLWSPARPAEVHEGNGVAAVSSEATSSDATVS